MENVQIDQNEVVKYLQQINGNDAATKNRELAMAYALQDKMVNDKKDMVNVLDKVKQENHVLRQKLGLSDDQDVTNEDK